MKLNRHLLTGLKFACLGMLAFSSFGNRPVFAKQPAATPSKHIVIDNDGPFFGQQSAAVPFKHILIDKHGPDQIWGKGVGDLDGDGRPDLVAGGYKGGGLVWYENPTWKKHQIAKGSFSTDIAVADINGDGDNDVVTLRYSPNGKKMESIWYENPGEYGPSHKWKPHIIGHDTLHDVEVADLNGDGKLDAIGRDQSEWAKDGNILYIYMQTTPTSWARRTMPIPPGEGLKVTDLNDDGKPDIVVSNIWLENKGHGKWVKHTYTSTWTHQDAYIDVGDFNGDGRKDIVVSPAERVGGTYRISWFEQPSNPMHEPWTEHIIARHVGTDHHFIGAADFNLDGLTDIATAKMQYGKNPDNVALYLNEDKGQSWKKQVIATTGSHSMRIVDIDGDGDPDLYGANCCVDTHRVDLWKNMTINKPDSPLKLNQWTYIPIDTKNKSIVFGLTFCDLNGDGKTDILTGRHWYRNPGGDLTGHWKRMFLGKGMDAMLCIDADNNGQPDIIAQRNDSAYIGVYWLKPTNAEATSFKTRLIGKLPNESRDHTSQGYTIARLNADGKPDIVFSNDNGDYYFQIPYAPAAGPWPRVHVNTDATQEGVTPGDINGDGKIDIVASSHKSIYAVGKEVDYWINAGDGLGGWKKQVVGHTAYEVSRMRVADINNDGKPDIVAVDDNLKKHLGNVYWFEQINPKKWVKHIIKKHIGSLESVTVGDFNKDGNVDVATGDHRGDNLRTIVWENMGDGKSWTPHVVDTGKDSHSGARAVDIDGDGDLDIVSIAFDNYQDIRLWRNDAISNAKNSTAKNKP